MPASFASAVADSAGLAPDNAQDRTPVEPVVAPEKAAPVKSEPVKTDPVKTEPVKAAPEKAASVEKEVVADENPNLSGEPVKTAKFEESDEIPPEMLVGMTKKAQDKAKETWKSNKQERRAAESERDTIKAEAETLRTQLAEASKATPEIERLKKELEETRARLSENEGEISITRVESTRQFKEHVTNPMNEIKATVDGIAAKYEVPASAIMDAIREPDATKRGDAIEVLAEDFKGYDRNEIYEAAKQHARAEKVATEMRANAKTKLDELTQMSQRELEQVSTANLTEYRETAGAQWKALQEQYPLLRPVEGKQAWNDYIGSKGREAESLDVNKLPVADVARMKVAELALPELAKATQFFQKRTKELETELAAANDRIKDYVKATPGAGDGTTVNGDKAKVGSRSFTDSVFAED